MDAIRRVTQLMVSNLPNLLPHIQAGKVRALAVTSPQRLPYLPGVPTYAESGFPQLNRMSWFGLVAPAKTPVSVIARLNDTVNKVLESDAARAALQKSGAVPQGGTPEEFSKTMVSERALQSPVIRETRITLD